MLLCIKVLKVSENMNSIRNECCIPRIMPFEHVKTSSGRRTVPYPPSHYTFHLLLPLPDSPTSLASLRHYTPYLPGPRPLLVHRYLIMLFFPVTVHVYQLLYMYTSYCTCIPFTNIYSCYP